MIYSAHQPNYFPYLGLFYKIYKSDTFVFLDDVQFTKSSGPAHERNIICKDDFKIYIKVPIRYHHGDRINQVKINNKINWKDVHLKKISECYAGTPHYEEIIADVNTIFNNANESLAELNMDIIRLICRKFAFSCTFYKSSDMKIHSTRTDRLIEIGKLLHGDVYYSGIGAKAYMDCKAMIESGIVPVFSDYQTAKYTTRNQLCLPNMSVLDYLFFYGYTIDPLGWSK